MVVYSTHDPVKYGEIKGNLLNHNVRHKTDFINSGVDSDYQIIAYNIMVLDKDCHLAYKAINSK